VEAMKAERQRLREEACAIKLQAAWRIKKARAKVERLKAEKQRLLMEGAAMMFQVSPSFLFLIISWFGLVT
jgi:hypothetical protein